MLFDVCSFAFSRRVQIAPGIEQLYAGAKPATMRRYGETDDKTEEVI